MAYVPVIMADGSVGQIAKSDLASVVAGVLVINREARANSGFVPNEEFILNIGYGLILISNISSGSTGLWIVNNTEVTTFKDMGGILITKPTEYQTKVKNVSGENMSISVLTINS